MTVFASDTFTDSDETLLTDHAPEVGGAWQLRAGLSPNIDSNQLESFNKWSHTTNNATPGGAEYDITFDIIRPAAGGANLGALARLTDASNLYRFFYNHWVTKYLISKRLAGTWSTLDSTTEALPEGTNAMKFEIRDSAKKGYAGGAEKVSTADDALTDAGNVGTYLSFIAADWYMDNFVADDVGAPPAGAAIMQPMKVWWAK